jgi:hypothetical protein
MLLDEAVQNFSGARFATRSFCTTPVELLSRDGLDTRISHGTGFFWHRCGIDYVVTNWHVLSGRNPFTGEMLSVSNGFIPDRIRVHGWKVSSHGNTLSLLRTGWTAELGDEGADIMKEPPMVRGKVVDIAAIPVPPGFVIEKDLDAAGQAKFGRLDPRVNMMTEDKIVSQAGDECMIVGYPLITYTGLYLPIWKRGSLATDTNMSVDDSPAFLIDAATSSAMSGSPIFRRVSGVLTKEGDGTVSETTGYQFVGVYAGRLESAELERVNVGYGWFGNHVDEAIDVSWNRFQRLADLRRRKGDEAQVDYAGSEPKHA